MCTERAHSGQRWVGSGSDRPESGHGGALPCSPLRRQERGPHAPTETSLGTRCPQRVRTGLGTRGYGATPRGGLQGMWRAPWGSSDAAPTPLGGGSGRPLAPSPASSLRCGDIHLRGSPSSWPLVTAHPATARSFSSGDRAHEAKGPCQRPHCSQEGTAPPAPGRAPQAGCAQRQTCYSCRGSGLELRARSGPSC